MTKPSQPQHFWYRGSGWARQTTATLTLAIVLTLTLTACGGGDSDGGGGNNDADSFNRGDRANSNVPYGPVELHLGYENEASATRINFPRYINANSVTWNIAHNEEFRQLGALVDTWDQAQRGEMSLPETRNTRVLGAQQSEYYREVRIIRTSWQEVGERCGYNAEGEPNNGCAYFGDMPRCSIYVPRQQLYAGGDIDRYNGLLGHEMWHCIVGSFH
ncbi:MAG: hypothetical protein R3352_03875 [Salinisphaeraceae bacterium]|nr:hypothetical protein [Salinisphaeraceae bacterium]